MKKRVSIYIDSDAWEVLKDEAWKRRKSASAFLEEIITGDLPVVPSEKTGVALVSRQAVEEIDDIDIETENKKLLEKREKISNLKENLSWNGGYSKNRQLGKKEAR